MALGTYNRTPANRSGGTQLFEAKYDLACAVTAVMGAGVTIQANAAFDSTLDAEIDPRFGFDEYYLMTASCALDSVMNAVITPVMAMAEAMKMTAEPVQTERYAMDAALAGAATIKAVIYLEMDLGGSMVAFFSGMQTVEYTMTFANLTIPPGGSLIVDSEFFTAVMNGANVIDQYDGDWLEVTHKMQCVDVSATTSGKLHVSLLYRERYL